jgi:hypothetical protein
LGFDVKIEQARAFGSELVDTRGGSATEDPATINTQLAIAKVVSQHEDDIRLLVRLSLSLAGAEHEGRSHRAKSKASDQ